MPQPRNTRAQDQTPETPQGTATPPAQDSANGQPDTHDAWADALLTDGDALAVDKTQLFERIGANREMLRNLKKTGKLSEDRVKRIDAMYPERERKPRKSKDAPADNADTASAASDAPTPSATTTPAAS